MVEFLENREFEKVQYSLNFCSELAGQPGPGRHTNNDLFNHFFYHLIATKQAAR